MKYKNLIPIPLAILFILLALPIHAQRTNIIQGTVTDAETSHTVRGAAVCVLGTSLRAITDDQGHYCIENLQDGTYDIQVSCATYAKQIRQNIVLTEDETQNVDFRLSRLVIEIPEIVVSAEKVEQTSRSASATVNILSSEEIARRNVTTLDQALESVPGINMGRSAGTATNSMSIRGSSDTLGGGVGNRVLLLIDGRPAITADTGGANWGLLPMDVVERVEVVKGALSPLYGSNAMGGVVNFVTKSPTPSGSTKLNLGWGYYGKQAEKIRYTDKTTDFGDVGILHSNSYRNLGYVLNLSGKRSDGYRQNTDFSLYNLYSKVQYISKRDLELAMSLGGTWLERGFPHIWLINNTDPFVHPLKIDRSKTNDRQEKRIWDIDLSLRSPINSKTKVSANLYHTQNYSESQYNPDDLEGDTRPFGFYTDSNAEKTGALLQMDLSHLRRNYLVLGLDAQIDAVDSHPADIMFGKHQAETLAGFAQDRITITDDLTVMLGARYDYRHLSESQDEGQLSPKLGVSYQVNDDTALRFSVGQAFRAPSLAEIYLKQSINSGIDFRQNPDLRSEKLRFYAEAGVRRRLFNLLSTDTSLFIYDYSDMIFWESITETEYQVINLNHAVIKGAEAGVNLSWRGLSAVASYAYLDAEDRTEGRTDDKLPYKPRHSAYTALDYQYDRIKLGASLRYVSEVEEAIFYPNDAPDAFYVVNAKLSYSLSNWTTLSIAVNNLLNRQYEEMGRYRMPGRSIVFRMVLE